MARKTRGPAGPIDSVLFSSGDVAYELIRELGVGAHGERRLLARSLQHGSVGAQVVVKMLSHLDDTRTRKRLEEEVQLASHLEHPGIARIHGLHEVKGVLYVVQEFVEGCSLEEIYTDALLCGRFCSERFVLYVAAELAAALHHAHTRTDAQGQPLGIVHRDIHPARVRLGTLGQVKLVDFGLAFSRLPGRRVTSVPRVSGHVIYTSPEQLLQRRVDARSDLFALGLVMLELLTGKHLLWLLEDVDLRQVGRDLATLPPDKLTIMQATVQELERLHGAAMRREGLAQLARRASSFGFEEVERSAREVSEPTRFILHKLLRREPGERYPSAAELEHALRGRLRTLEPYGAEEACEEIFLLQAGAAGLPVQGLAAPGRLHASAFMPHPDEITTQPS